MPNGRSGRATTTNRLNPRPRRRRCRTSPSARVLIQSGLNPRPGAEAVLNASSTPSLRFGLAPFVSIRVRGGGGAEPGAAHRHRGALVSIRVRGGGEPSRSSRTRTSTSQSASAAEAVPNGRKPTPLPRKCLNPRPRRRRCRTEPPRLPLSCWSQSASAAEVTPNGASCGEEVRRVSIRVRGGDGAEPAFTAHTDSLASQSASEAEAVPKTARRRRC